MELHPQEDLAAFQLSGDNWGTVIAMGAVDVRASFEYCTWGYPVDVLHEVVTGGVAVPRPDLVFTAGHVRRRIRNLNQPKVKGSLLAELTVPAGSGCSGGPVLSRRPQDAFSLAGMYLGERISDEVQVGYALLTEVFADWQPAGVGRTIRAEASEMRQLPTA